MKGNVLAARIELRWFFEEAEGDLGLRGHSYEREEVPEPSDPHAAARHRADNVARWTEVSRRLDAIGVQHGRTLRLAFTPHRWVGLERWYELAGVAALIVDPDDVVAAGRSILALSPAKAEVLKVGAQGRLRLALSAFVGAR